MKKIFTISAFILCGILPGCNIINNATPQIEEGKDCLVSFNPVGEIITSESPLTKASSSPTDDLYCVQVLQNDSYFAMGYFDNLESMKLYLKQGSKYDIIISVVKNAKNLLGDRYNMTQGSICNYDYSNDVFNFYNRYKANSSSTSYSGQYSSSSSYYYPINQYQYNYLNKLYYYSTESSTILTYVYYYESNYHLNYYTKAMLNNTMYPSCDGWFYGEAVDYSPTGDYETLDLNFKRVGFKLKYELSGVTDGEVTVKVYNSKRTFIENTTNTSSYVSEEQFIAFYDAQSAWEYADNYSENLTVAVSWKRGIGVTQDLGTKVIQVKRNCLNNIKITLGSDDRNGELNISAESEDSMGENTSDHIVS